MACKCVWVIKRLQEHWKFFNKSLKQNQGFCLMNLVMKVEMLIIWFLLKRCQVLQVYSSQTTSKVKKDLEWGDGLGERRQTILLHEVVMSVLSQLIDVHLLQKPLVSSPFIVLGACLNSTVLLRSFSRLSTPYHPPVTSRNLYLQLLFRYNLGMPLYLWLVSLLETFKER